MKALVFALGLALAASPAALAQDKPEKPDLKLSVGGKPLLYYLPLTVAERMGYFKDEGLNVEIADLGGGAKSLQALMGGSVDVTTGSYEHTIQMQAQGKPLVALAQLGRYPGIAFAVRTEKVASYKGPADLKGMKIGVTAPGSSTNFLVNLMLAHAGLKPDDVSIIGVGGGPSAVAAIKRGEIDAMSNTDPVISQLESQDLVKVMTDTRTAAGTKEVYGGPYPAAVLYVPPAFAEANPKTTQAVVNALVRALKFMAKSTPEEIAAKMPEEYLLGDKASYIAALTRSREMYSTDGRFEKAGADTVYATLTKFDPAIAAAKIDLAKTWDDKFVEVANKKYP